MSETAIIVQARSGSTRLPNKMTIPFFEGQSILEIIIKRLSERYRTILATTNHEDDQVLVNLVAKFNSVSIYRGSEHNVLERFIKTAEFYNIDTIIRVCADNPFINVQMIDSLLKLYNGEDYCSYMYSNGKPTILGHLGLFCEITSINTLKKVNRLTREMKYQEHVTNFIYTNPNIFNVKLHRLPADIRSYEGIRLTIDTQRDFDLVKEIYKKFGGRQTTEDVEKMIQYISSNNVILQTMAVEIKNNSK